MLDLGASTGVNVGLRWGFSTVLRVEFAPHRENLQVRGLACKVPLGVFRVVGKQLSARYSFE